MTDNGLRHARIRCPCCGYVTLHSRARFEICQLCWWQDDGQDDANADEVLGGPNQDLSLTQARRNFRDHMTMYAHGQDTRIGGEDSLAELDAKRAIVAALDSLDAQPSEEDADRLWAEVESAEAILDAESKRKILEYERRSDRARLSNTR